MKTDSRNTIRAHRTTPALPLSHGNCDRWSARARSSAAPAPDEIGGRLGELCKQTLCRWERGDLRNKVTGRCRTIRAEKFETNCKAETSDNIIRTASVVLTPNQEGIVGALTRAAGHGNAGVARKRLGEGAGGAINGGRERFDSKLRD